MPTSSWLECAQQLRDCDTLDHRLRLLLRASLPRCLRRGPVDHRHRHHARPLPRTALPKPRRNLPALNPNTATTHFHCYAHRLCYPQRAAIYTRPPSRQGRHIHVRSRLSTPASDRGRRHQPKLLLLDRGFNNAGVVRYLQAARQPFIMPQAVHGKKPKDGVLTGLRAIHAHHPTGWTRYSWKPNGVSQRRVRVELCVLRRRRIDRRGHRTFLYACWGVRRAPRNVYNVYRKRFGVETSYRQMNQLRIRTCTRNPTLRCCLSPWRYC